MLFDQKQLKSVILLSCFFVNTLYPQELYNLAFGDSNSLDVATWNIEWFPKNDHITIDYVTEIINLLELDILAIQEVNDTTMFNHMLASLPEYSGYYESSWFAGLAYVYKNGSVEVNDIYEIYTTSSFWNAFPRSPMVMDINFMGENYFLINNHFKCCGDGIIDHDDISDEENRRYIAMNLIKEYIDNNLSDKNVIVLGDLNDDIAEPLLNNVFQEVIDDSNNYRFVDIGIAQGNSSDWSFPNWPSHLDHILITDELFNGINTLEVETIKIDQFLDGGWNEYDQNISDHRPVAIKFIFSLTSPYDVNDDGIVNDSDLLMLLSFILENIEPIDLVDINLDLEVNIFDLLLLSDYIQEL